MPVRRRKKLPGLGRRNVPIVADDGGFHFAVATGEQCFGFGWRKIRHRPYDAASAIRQLGIRRPHVDHQVAIGLAKLDHRAGGEHVENHLGGGAGLHAGRTADDFGPNDDGNADITISRELRIAVAA